MHILIIKQVIVLIHNHSNDLIQNVKNRRIFVFLNRFQVWLVAVEN